jgi:hypothetical protein
MEYVSQADLARGYLTGATFFAFDGRAVQARKAAVPQLGIQRTFQAGR